MSFLLFVFMGAFAGVLAGLLGIGGGLVLVPFLTFTFMGQGVSPEYVVHMALGTSLTSIIFTSISSMRAHNKRGAVIWPVLWRITPGILLGTFIGSWVAAYLPSTFLKIFFSAFLYYVAFQMLMGIKPKPSRQLPEKKGMFGVGNIIGFFSSWVGIGGGTLSVPFLTFCNIPMHKAIGTSAAIGLPIAIAGAVGYISSGWSCSDLPQYSLGFVNLIALVGIVIGSVSTAPIGAKLAHSLDVPKLKKVFAVLLLILGTRMWWSVL